MQTFKEYPPPPWVTAMWCQDELYTAVITLLKPGGNTVISHLTDTLLLQTSAKTGIS